MKILSNSKDIRTELKRLMKQYNSYRWAVAWASPSADELDFLAKRVDRIKKMIVGIHFYQTHPSFIEKFKDNSHIRYILHPNGVYHPKVYLFEDCKGKWECVIGSPNYTHSAFSSNLETAVLISDSDNDSETAYLNIKEMIEGYWEKGESIDENKLNQYKNVWKSKKQSLRKLSGQYDSKEQDTKSPLKSKIFSLSWEEYFAKIQNEDDHNLEERIAVLDFAYKIFVLDKKRLCECSERDNEKIAGFKKIDGIDYKFFGDMHRAKKFYDNIYNKNRHISDALDEIPVVGEIKEKHYMAFLDTYRKGFPKGIGVGLATATRLLAMKRPDYFICLDNRNKEALCKNFDIARASVELDNYWERIVERVLDSVWWMSDEPTDEIEKKVWRYRAAFLDALYYEP